MEGKPLKQQTTPSKAGQARNGSRPGMQQLACWRHRASPRPQHTVPPVAVIHCGRMAPEETSKGKVCGVRSGGAKRKPPGGSPRTPRTRFVPPAASCHQTISSEPQHPGLHWRLLTPSRPSMYQNPRVLEGKQVVSINHANNITVKPKKTKIRKTQTGWWSEAVKRHTQGHNHGGQETRKRTSTEGRDCQLRIPGETRLQEQGRPHLQVGVIRSSADTPQPTKQTPSPQNHTSLSV